MEQADVLIIGGGITGLGVLAAVTGAGYRALLIEAGELSAETSANSLRIIHGGLRYLQHLNLLRVVESARAQAALMLRYPELVRPLKCLLPLNRRGMTSRLPIACAAEAYSRLLPASATAKHGWQLLSAADAATHGPRSTAYARYGALLWHDAVVTDPAALAEGIRRECAERGGQILTNTRVTGVEVADKRVAAAIAGDHERKFTARCLINCAGPRISSLRPAQYTGLLPVYNNWCAAFNLLVSARFSDGAAFAVRSRTGRMFFCVPRGEGSAIGTYYYRHLNPGLPAAPSAAQVAQFISEWNEALPECRIAERQVAAVEAGVLPAANDGLPLAGRSTLTACGRYLEILSTKYTTFGITGEKAAAWVRSLGPPA